MKGDLQKWEQTGTTVEGIFKGSWEGQHGVVPPSPVFSACGQPRCTNPRHLKLTKGQGTE